MISLRKLWQITNIAILTAVLAAILWFSALSIECKTSRYFSVGLIFAVACPVISLLLSRKRKFSDLRKSFYSQLWPLRIPKIASALLVSVCLVTTILAVTQAFWFGSLAGAMTLVIFGQPEAGERFFKSIPDPTHIKEYISLANVSNFNIEVDNKDLENVANKVKIVKKVYGKNSAQLAHLHEFTAYRYYNESFEEESEEHFEQAVSIFQKLNDFEAVKNIDEKLHPNRIHVSCKSLRVDKNAWNCGSYLFSEEFRDSLRAVPYHMVYIFCLGILAFRAGEWILLKLLIFRWVRDYKFSEHPDISLLGKLAVAEFLVGNTFESDSYSRLSMARLNDDD